MDRTARVLEVVRTRRMANGRRRLGIVVAGLLALAGCATSHDPDGPPLQLHRGGSGPRFTHNGPAKQSVYNWASLDTAFVAVLAPDATALAEARRATPFRTAALAANVGTIFFASKMLLTGFGALDDITQDDVDSVNSDFVFVVGFGIGATVFEQLAHRHIRQAVSTFNVGVTSNGGSRGGLPRLLEESVHNIFFTPTYRPGYGFRLVSGSTFQLR